MEKKSVMKKITGSREALLAVVLIVAMLAACLSACGSKQDSSEPAANTSDSSTKDTASTGSGELVIGGVGPLTGDYAVYGNAVKNGAQIAVDEINAEGGDIQFELNYQDDEGDAEKAQAALKTVTKRLDMAAAKHVIHKNQASNRKSGLAKLVNSINA